MSEISFVDTTLRDGNQSLWDATGLTTGMILPVMKDMDQVGFKAVDFVASTHMGVSVAYHKENPWERIRLAAKAMPHTPLCFGTTGRRFIGFKRCPDSILSLVIERIAANGIRRIWLVDAAHDMEVIYKNARMAKAAGIEDFMVALSYSVSPAHTDEYYAEKTERITQCPDVDTVYLKDQGGLLTPDRVKTLVPAIQSKLNGRPLEIHSHCTTGHAPQVYMEAIGLGVTTIHTAIPPLCDGTAQPCVFEMLEKFQEAGLRSALNVDKLNSISEYLMKIAEKHNRPVGKRQEYDPAYYEHQLPGGMVSTLKRNLSEIGVESRLQEVLIEISKVRRDLGYPIMVTPFSQLVGTQATINVVSGERYKMIPDGIIEYVVGLFGETPAPIDPNVIDKVNSYLKTEEIRKQEFLQPSVQQIRENMGVGEDVSDEEFLLRYAMTHKEVDAMLSAGG